MGKLPPQSGEVRPFRQKTCASFYSDKLVIFMTPTGLAAKCITCAKKRMCLMANSASMPAGVENVKAGAQNALLCAGLMDS